jgi:hypothetical protein
VNRTGITIILILAATASLVACNRQPGPHRHEQLELTDTADDVIRKLALGDPVAAAILKSFVIYAERQDPMPHGGFFSLLHFDTKNIRGQQIVDLYTRQCGYKMECLYNEVKIYYRGPGDREEEEEEEL